ncbi:GNAT family protein [Accumulibacter sp.]|uniref:GNAT family N-acetyltransferase n=1 Tax=Accumulibacter sp. TaxID=2053492 RepID=UPI0025CE3749|nr:GNAT family protein [Accumulibacter sp.]MCM8610763.1 GNAT family N-acetyltransferase [Accumulibacter sp.]MCM8635343.1 GNAT family N-acetyltransferase [Accumulibacter sp.]MCM8638655.1 GNAT family N-acetyltransferase [Accumulibacter sp.]
MASVNDLGQPVGEQLFGWRVPPHPPRRELAGSLVRLEPLAAERHAASLHAANQLDSQGRNWTYLGYGPFAEVGDYAAWIDTNCRGPDPLFYAIVEQDCDLATGVASYLRIAPPSGTIEIGHINFSPRLQRTAAATEAIYLLLRQAFALGYRRCEWKCDALNSASRAAALRFGLSFEGIFRQAAVVKGRNRDTAWYAAIDREWPALAAAFGRWLDGSNFDSAGRQRVSLAALTRQARRIALGADDALGAAPDRLLSP